MHDRPPNGPELIVVSTGKMEQWIVALRAAGADLGGNEQVKVGYERQFDEELSRELVFGDPGGQGSNMALGHQ